MLDLAFIAKYPFSKEAKEFVEQRGVQIDFESVEKGVERVVKALCEGEIPKPAVVLEKELASELAAYAIARMIISLLGSRQFISRYAVAESKRAHAFLKAEKKETVGRIAQQLGIRVRDTVRGFSKSEQYDELSQATHREEASEGVENESGGRAGELLMSAFDYLCCTPRDVNYKLVNKELRGGFVRLKESEFIRVVSEAVRKKVESELPLKAKNAPVEVLNAVEEVKLKLREKAAAMPEVQAVASEDYAPCIKKMLEDLKMGENLPHIARFCLAVYLLNVGVKADDVIKVFSTAPDYNEQTTRYQVEYAKNKGYKMSGCSMMDLYGLCTQKCGIRNPLSYGRKKTYAKQANTKKQGG